MRKLVFAGVLCFALLLSGCFSQIRLDFDFPVIVVDVPHRTEFQGYLYVESHPRFHWKPEVMVSGSSRVPFGFEPLSGASVTLLGNQYDLVAYTDLYGYFAFRGVTRGGKTLIIEHRYLPERVFYNINLR